MKKIRNILQIIGIFLIASCSHEEVAENPELPSDKIAVSTEVSVDGVDLADAETRASSAAGYTTGDGLYDIDDNATVAAYANNGYELVRFYDKENPSVNLGSSHSFEVSKPQTFKAEFRAVSNYTIAVSANPSAGGSVSGGGSYKGGSSCTVIAVASSGYAFDGWYENDTKVSSNESYLFTVSSNRTLTAKFVTNRPIVYITLVDEQLESRECNNIGYITAPWDYDGELPNYTIDERLGIKTYEVYGDPYPPLTIEAHPHNDNRFIGWYDENGILLSSSKILEDRDLESFPIGSHIYASFSSRILDRSATVTINLLENNIKLDGSAIPNDWPADLADVHVYKLSSTNGITGTLRLKESESATHTYNITNSRSYYPLTFYRGQEAIHIRFTNWEWIIGDQLSAGTFSNLNSIKATMVYNNVTYTLNYGN